MGVVYKARQTRLRRIVALKMVLSGTYASTTELGRFRTKAEAIALLEHPHIVQIHEVGEHDCRPYFSLEFCAGGSLEKKLKGTPLDSRAAAILVKKLAGAMQAAHDKGVIHRDLKPANVLLAEDGTPKITDFGLARKLDEAARTQTGAIMGTPSYMAPEQASAERKQVGPACDVYALGAILHECLTRRPPFRSAG
jgi:serine/threonine-protein kinase